MVEGRRLFTVVSAVRRDQESAVAASRDKLDANELFMRRGGVKDAALHPREWVAQRRFEAVPVDTPTGPMYPCVGIYTVAGRAVGAYTRLSPHPVIDYAAVDVALLVSDSA